MIAVMQPNATTEDIDQVVEVLRRHNLKAQISKGEQRTVIGVIGTGFPPDLLETLEVLPGVDRVTRITRPVQAGQPRLSTPRHGRRGRRRAGRRARVRGHGRAVLGREPRPARARPPAAWPRPAPRSCAAARSSRARRRTPSRASASDGLDLLLEEQPRQRPADHHRGDGARAGGARGETWPASSRSARATCRTFRCCERWAERASQCCSSAGSRLRSRSG